MRFIDIIATANSNLAKNKLRTLLTIIAVFIGAFTLSLTNGIGTGFSEYFNSQIANVGFDNSLIITKKSDFSISGNDVKEYQGTRKNDFGMPVMQLSDLDEVNKIDGLSDVQRSYDVQPEYITTGEKKFEVSVSAFINGLRQDVMAGSLIKADDSNGILLTKAYVDALQLGDAKDAVGKKAVIAIKDPKENTKDFPLTVRGVITTGLIDNGALQVSKQTVEAMNTFQSGGLPSIQNQFSYATARYDKNASEEDIAAVKKVLNNKGLEGKTIEEQIGAAAQFIKIFQIALNSFGAIALIAATFGIVNTLLMAVHERTREIGLSKALGMSRRTVFALFSLEAVLIGFWGSLLGVLAAKGVGAIFNNIAANSFLKDFDGLQVSFPLTGTLVIMGLIMAIAFIAGALPSRRASKLDPIEALRYE